MALTVGTGPFGGALDGAFNFDYDAPERVLYFEATPRRVRVVVAGETVADSARTKLLHETGLMPVYYLPKERRADRSPRTDRARYALPIQG